MNTTPNTQSPAADDKIAERIANYKSRLLADAQAATMLADLKVVVGKSKPHTADVAANWLSIATSFLADVAPAGGGKLDDFLNHATVFSWLAAEAKKGRSRHTLSTRRGTLDTLIRAHIGAPSRVNSQPSSSMRPAPLAASQIEELRVKCAASGLPAIRGFVAVLGTGLTDSSLEGGRFEALEDDPGLVLRNGRRLPIALDVGGLEAVDGQIVMYGDVRDLLSAAAQIGLYLDPMRARQTFMAIALHDAQPLLGVIRRFRMTEPALDHIRPYLAADDVLTNAAIAAAFRG